MKHLQRIALALGLALALAACAPGGSSSAAPSAPAETPVPTPVAFTGNPLTGEPGEGYADTRPVAITLRTREGSAPLWGLADADVVVAGVSEGSIATMMAMYANGAGLGRVGPVGPGRDLTLQMALPMNAVPVHIDKNVYAANLLSALTYQDLDGYHIGKAAFAFDDERKAAGANEENCWYTTGELIQAGLAQYGSSLSGQNQPLFAFDGRPAPAAQNATDLRVGFSGDDVKRFVFDAGSGAYTLCTAEGDPVTDGNSGAPATFTNVLVLYASSGIKDDSYTRQYDMSGGTGLYLTGGGWETIQWSKGDATAPLLLTDAGGEVLTVSPGRSFIAIWGGYYGQTLALTAADGTEQILPEKPALLESGISDEAAQAAEEAYQHAHAVIDAEAALAEAQLQLEEAQSLWQEAQGTADTADDDNAAYLVALAQQTVDEAQAALDALQAEQP